MTCTSDAAYIAAVQAFRAVLPRPRYLVTTAAWSIGAYGEGWVPACLPCLLARLGRAWQELLLSAWRTWFQPCQASLLAHLPIAAAPPVASLGPLLPQQLEQLPAGGWPYWHVSQHAVHSRQPA
jgi:hypothetical protein